MRIYNFRWKHGLSIHGEYGPTAFHPSPTAATLLFTHILNVVILLIPVLRAARWVAVGVLTCITVTSLSTTRMANVSGWLLPVSSDTAGFCSPPLLFFLRGAAAFSCISGQLADTSTNDLTAAIDRCNFNNNFTHDISSLSLYVDPFAPSKHFTLTGNTESATFVNWVVVLAPSIEVITDPTSLFGPIFIHAEGNTFADMTISLMGVLPMHSRVVITNNTGSGYGGSSCGYSSVVGLVKDFGAYFIEFLAGVAQLNTTVVVQNNTFNSGPLENDLGHRAFLIFSNFTIQDEGIVHITGNKVHSEKMKGNFYFALCYVMVPGYKSLTVKDSGWLIGEENTISGDSTTSSTHGFSSFDVSVFNYGSVEWRRNSYPMIRHAFGGETAFFIVIQSVIGPFGFVNLIDNYGGPMGGGDGTHVGFVGFNSGGRPSETSQTRLLEGSQIRIVGNVFPLLGSYCDAKCSVYAVALTQLLVEGSATVLIENNVFGIYRTQIATSAPPPVISVNLDAVAEGKLFSLIVDSTTTRMNTSSAAAAVPPPSFVNFRSPARLFTARLVVQNSAFDAADRSMEPTKGALADYARQHPTKHVVTFCNNTYYGETHWHTRDHYKAMPILVDPIAIIQNCMLWTGSSSPSQSLSLTAGTDSAAETKSEVLRPSETHSASLLGTSSAEKFGSVSAALTISGDSPSASTTLRPTLSNILPPTATAIGSASASHVLTADTPTRLISASLNSAPNTASANPSPTISSRLSRSAPPPPRRVVPIPRPPLSITVEAVGTVAGSVSVAVVGVLGVTTARLGGVGALGRMVACGADGDGDDGLPFIVHPLAFRLIDTDDGDDGLYFAAVLGNTIIIPLLLGLLMRLVAPRVVLFVRTRQLIFSKNTLRGVVGSMTEAEALEAISWPSVIVGPFVLLSEGTAAAIVASFASGESYGPLFGVIGLVPVLGICGVWAHALAFVVPRRRLYLSDEAAASCDDEGSSCCQWLVSATAEWRPETAAPAAVGCNGQNSTEIRTTVRDGTINTNDGNSFPIGNATDDATLAGAVVTETALAKNEAFIGGRRWLYAEAANFGLALLVGVMEGLPEGTFCRGRILVALGATAGQCVCGCLALVPLEVALEGLTAACVIPMAVCAVVLTFRRTESGDESAGADVADVIAALEIIGSILAVATPLLMPCVSFIAAARASCSSPAKEGDNDSDQNVPLVPIASPPPIPPPQQGATALTCPQLQGDTAAATFLLGEDEEEEGDNSEHQTSVSSSMSQTSAGETSVAQLFGTHSREQTEARGSSHVFVLSTSTTRTAGRGMSPWAIANNFANIAADGGDDYSDSEAAADRMASPYYRGAPLAATRQPPSRGSRSHAVRRAKQTL